MRKIALLLMAILVTACNDFLIERNIRVVVANQSPDPIRLNIAGDDWNRDFAPQTTDQVTAKIRFVHSNGGSTSPTQRLRGQYPVSITNLRTGELSRTQQCMFEVGSLTTIEYSGRGNLNCQISW